MNRSNAEANMSIDDLISNAVYDDLIEKLSDKQSIEQLNIKIDQFNEKIENKQTDKLNEQIIEDKNGINVKQIDISIEKSITHQLNEPAIKQVNKPDLIENIQQSNISLNIQQIIDQVNHVQNEFKQSPNEVDQQSDSKMIEPAIKNIDEPKEPIKATNNSFDELNKSTNECDMNADESIRFNYSQLNQSKVNLSTKSNEIDMSVDDSLVLTDIRNIFETSSSEFIISKPLKKMETPKRAKNVEVEMDVSCSENDSLILREVKIENNPTDCLDKSPFIETLAPPKQVFKLSRKRLNCETESPIKRPHLASNLFKSCNNNTPISALVSTKKWRSNTYTPMTSSPKKMDLDVSPLKTIDSNIVCDSVDNLLVSNLNQLIQKSDQLPNLMGDYSSTYALPLISGRHKDLKTISPETLANLMNGEYKKSIHNFTIVDSRYPYEYEGGHIDGSKNIYHREDINKYFFGTDKPTLITDKKLIKSTIHKNSKQSSTNSMQRAEQRNSLKLSAKRLSVIKEGENDENKVIIESTNELNNSITNSPIKRHAIIFHCEFSSERGPTMCRFLRKIDRELNENCYPNLYYPEIYLLHGGYKLFFEKFKDLCYPQTYLPMHSTDHKNDLIKFRTKSKSWNCERKWKSAITK